MTTHRRTARIVAESVEDARSYLTPRTTPHGWLMDAEAALRQHADRIDAEAAEADWPEVFTYAEARCWDAAAAVKYGDGGGTPQSRREALRALAPALNRLGGLLAQHAEEVAR